MPAKRPAFSKTFETLLALTREGAKRPRPLALERIARRRLAPDVEAFVAAWRAHRPGRVTIGDFELTDATVGDEVPQGGAPEGTARDDAFGLGVTGGGDLVAVQRDPRGVFSQLVRVI